LHIHLEITKKKFNYSWRNKSISS